MNSKYRELKGPKTKRSPYLVYLQAYFVTIATILGTGILGLPVTLVRSGLYPFLVSFLFGAFMQTLLVYFFVELLQLACAAQVKENKEECMPLSDIQEDAGYLASDEDDRDNSEEEDKTIENDEVKLANNVMRHSQHVKPPNLHMLGELFLGCGFSHFFDIVLVLQFIALLISYALAGSEAYAELIGIEHFYVIPVFCWVLTFSIVFALQYVQPVVSVLTFFKGSLLLGTVIVTFIVGAKIHRNVTNDFTETGAPFLMGTVALGGVVNTMPLMYSKIQPVKQEVRNFRFSVILGVLTCTVLNILWCWAVLDIVPQTSYFHCDAHDNISMVNMATSTCYSEISLEQAQLNGEISTLPLTKIIVEKYPSFYFVAILVELFIVVSITVSYLTVGAVLHHTLSGWIDAATPQKEGGVGKHNRYNNQHYCCSKRYWCKTLVSLFAFLIVFGIAMLNPQGFIDMLEKFASFNINLEAGLFVFLMLIFSQKRKELFVMIPLPIPKMCRLLQYLIPVYFGFAVIYDVYNTIVEITQGHFISAAPNTSHVPKIAHIQNNTLLTLVHSGLRNSTDRNETI